MSFTAKLGLLAQVDGSARYCYGDFESITSVAGPIEITKVKDEKPTEALISVNIRPDTGVPMTRETLIADHVASVLEEVIDVRRYARHQIQIVSQIVRRGESDDYGVKEFMSVVNSAFLALLDSGICLRSSFLASCCCISQDGQILIRPTEKQLKCSVSNHEVCYSIRDSKADALLYCGSKGNFSEQQLYEVLEKCKTDINEQFGGIREIVLGKVKDDYKWKEQ